MELIDALNETYELRRKNFMFKLTGALYRPFRQEYDACLSMFLPSESITFACRMAASFYPAGFASYRYNPSDEVYGTLMVSNARIFFCRYSDKRSFSYEIPADDITDVYYDTDPKEAYLRVNGRNIVFVIHDELAVVERLKKAVDELRYAQPEPEAAAPIQTNPADNMDQITEAIKNLKSLLDLGAITQEEFDAKKKQLLNL